MTRVPGPLVVIKTQHKHYLLSNQLVSRRKSSISLITHTPAAFYSNFINEIFIKVPKTSTMAVSKDLRDIATQENFIPLTIPGF